MPVTRRGSAAPAGAERSAAPARGAAASAARVRAAAATWLLALALALAACGRALLNLLGEAGTCLLSCYEAATLAVLHGWSSATSRWTHTLGAFWLSVFNRRSYRRQAASASREFQRAWSAALSGARSTFNALAEAEAAPGAGGTNGAAPPNGGAAAALAAPAPAPAPAEPPAARRGRAARMHRRSSSGGGAPPPRGADLFTAGAAPGAAAGGAQRRGLIEDARAGVELGIYRAFSAARRGLRRAALLAPPPAAAPATPPPPPAAAPRRGRWEHMHVATAGEAILAAGYALEEHLVTTADGYQLLMHRIPAPEARDAVLFVHGVLDTALGWVASGAAAGSPALAAADTGVFDVWLASTRANPPRVCVDPARRGLKYWHFSIDELAMQDVAAQVARVRARKASELGGGAPPPRVQVVAHSLGAAAVLMYAVRTAAAGRAHGLSRLVLLSPAGLHPSVPLALRPAVWAAPWAARLLDSVAPGRGLGLRLPSPWLRWLLFKLLADLARAPTLAALFTGALRFLTSGDASAWQAAIALPHYSPSAMPALALHVAAHLGQLAARPEFRMFDRGRAENSRRYGQDRPPSVLADYGLLRGTPVDLAAGSRDGLIPPRCVEAHAAALRVAGVRFSYRLFSFGHLDWTFGLTEGDAAAWVVQRLRLTQRAGAAP